MKPKPKRAQSVIQYTEARNIREQTKIQLQKRRINAILNMIFGAISTPHLYHNASPCNQPNTYTCIPCL